MIDILRKAKNLLSGEPSEENAQEAYQLVALALDCFISTSGAEDFFNKWAAMNIEVKGGNPKTYELLPVDIFRCMIAYAEFHGKKFNQAAQFEQAPVSSQVCECEKKGFYGKKINGNCAECNKPRS